MNFLYQLNDDGSFALYNNEIEDIYFSNIGAYNEALEKFVIPSNPFSYKTSKSLKILDVCYGMGYNSKSFVDYCLKNNLDYQFEIDVIDIDENILTLGLLVFDKNISDDVHMDFNKQLYPFLNIEQNLKNILNETWSKNILDDFRAKFKDNFEKQPIDLSDFINLSVLLHNIYYQNQENECLNLKIKLILGDLLKILPQINKKYDLIFHDAFSIRKQPDMWSDFVMRNYYRLLNNNGKFITYSNSRVLRRTLESVGFDVEINYNKEQKQNGTIAIKRES